MSNQEDTVNNGIPVMEDNTDSTQKEQARLDSEPLQNQAHYSHLVNRGASDSELQNCPVESHPLETATNPEPCMPSGSESQESLVEPEPCTLSGSDSQGSLAEPEPCTPLGSDSQGSLVEPEPCTPLGSDSLVEPEPCTLSGSDSLGSLVEPEPCTLSGSDSQGSLVEPEPCTPLGSDSLVEPEPCTLSGSDSLVEPEPCTLSGSDSLVEPEPCTPLGSDSLVEPEPCTPLGSDSLVEPEPCTLSGSDSLVEPAVITPSSCAEAAEEPRTVPLSSSATLSHATQLWVNRRDEPVKLRMENCGPGSESPLTIHQMFREAVESSGDRPALASKQEGEWVTLTWREYYEQCRAAAKSFIKLGLQRYHGVGILGFNSPEWFISEIGCILAGGLAAGIYTTNSPEACQYVAENCEANVLVVENDKQLAKILQVRDQLPHLKAIVQYKGEPKQKLPNVYSWAEFMEMGKDVPDEQLDIEINSLRANECCILIYTSGTTGTPKGVMLSHDNVTWTANAAGTMTHLRHGEEVVVSYLPLSHVAAQVNDMWIIMRFAGTTYFAEPDALKGSLGTTLKEVRPTSFLGVPRVWEKMQEKMKSIGAKSSPMRKRVADWAKSIGLQYNYSAMNGEHVVPWGFMLANNLVFKKVRAALGLDRCTMCFTGAAPITKETLEYFMSLNMPLMELYGMSESSAPHTISCPEDYHIMSCGKVMKGCKTKLDKPDADGNGEICFWGRHVFMGYLNMPEKTEEALDQDGWLHSGDLGKHDKNDFLFITGRIKELIITAGGENIPPVPTEDALKAEVAILSNAMLIGDKLKFLSMLLTLKCVVDEDGDPTDEMTPEALDFCQQHGVTATKVSEILANKEPAIYKAIQEGIERVNAKAASNAQKVQKWVILEKDFSVSGGELGPTMKLKRSVVVKMYQEKIDQMYAVPQERQ